MLVFLLVSGGRPPLRQPLHRCGDTSSRLAKRRNAVGSQTPTALFTAGTCTCSTETTKTRRSVTLLGARIWARWPKVRRLFAPCPARCRPGPVSEPDSTVPIGAVHRWVQGRKSAATIRREVRHSARKHARVQVADEHPPRGLGRTREGVGRGTRPPRRLRGCGA